ncbi:MAG: hypothetical protein HMLIMOIP_000660 [Candidatus Nitrosomirales archaeon]
MATLHILTNNRLAKKTLLPLTVSGAVILVVVIVLASQFQIPANKQVYSSIWITVNQISPTGLNSDLGVQPVTIAKGKLAAYPELKAIIAEVNRANEEMGSNAPEVQAQIRSELAGTLMREFPFKEVTAKLVVALPEESGLGVKTFAALVTEDNVHYYAIFLRFHPAT